jgi:hypothetical protein
MAYIVSVTETARVLTGATYTVALGAHQANDLLLCLLSQDGGATAITAPGGWTMIGTQAASQGVRQAWAYKVAASGAESNPTFSGSNDDWQGTCYVIRDADTTPVIAWQRSDWGNSSTIKTADSNAVAASSAGGTTVITAPADSLLLYSWCSDTGSTAAYLRCPINDLIADSRLGEDGTYGVTHISGHRQNGASAAVPSVTMYHSRANEGGNGWVLAISNNTGGTREKDCRAGTTELNWYGNFGTTQTPVTWQAPSSFAAAINGITCSATAPTVTDYTGQLATPFGSMSDLASVESTAGAWVGGTHTISSTDMTGKVLALQWELNVNNQSARLGADGVILALSDGTNWIAYQLSDKTAILQSTVKQAFIALGNATAYASSGTINLAAVTRVGIFHHRIGSVLTSTAVRFKNLFLMGAATLTGGGSARPLTFNTLFDALNSWGSVSLADKQGGAQVLGKASVQIGDGAKYTYFDSSASSFEYPLAFSASNAIAQNWNALASSVSVNIKAASTDTINLTAGVLATTLKQALTIDAASDTGATYSVAGTSFVGWAPVWKTGVACTAATFKGCAAVDFKGASITNVLARDGTDAALILAESGFSATGCTLTAGGSSIYGIRIAAAGTFSLASTTFSGFTKDIDVTATTGTVTINLAAGQATPTYQTAGATVNIVASPVFQTVTISGAVAGSRIQIYDTTSSTELYNGTPTFPYTWTDASPAAASRAIRLRVAKQSGASAKTFIEASIGTCGTASGSEAVSYLVNQTDDAVYNTNAIDGSTVTGITITPSPARVKVSIGGGSVTYPQIYAYQVYWLATATGIADEAAFIDAPDTANYLFTNFDIRNDSAVPLTITGGYGRDAVSGLVADIIDVAGSTGNIYPQPDHAIPYSSGSGLTAGQAAQLAAVTTSTANLTYSGTALQVDIVKVNGLAVSGSGTEANPWGPA